MVPPQLPSTPALQPPFSPLACSNNTSSSKRGRLAGRQPLGGLRVGEAEYWKLKWPCRPPPGGWKNSTRRGGSQNLRLAERRGITLHGE